MTARFRPLLFLARLSGNRDVIRHDVRRWLEVRGETAPSEDEGLLRLLAGPREFRNLFFHRLERGGGIAHLLAPLLAKIYRGAPTLFLWTNDIGPGLFIQHGHCTIVAAERIGSNCWIGHQVTLGHKDGGSPVIRDGVQVHTGAKVLGQIVLDYGCCVGANAVVLNDVPQATVVVGSPARVVSQDGRRVAPAG